MNNVLVKPRERNAILKSLRAGVVPSIGLQHIQVGRKDEIQALLTELEQIREGSAGFRFVVGRVGAGKTFFLNLIRLLAIEQKFVVLQADITPDRRLYATGGQARALYSELMRNLAIRTKIEGGALEAVVSGWISEVDREVRASGGNDETVSEAIDKRLRSLAVGVNSDDFISVIRKYLEGYLKQDADLQSAALRWLRAEYGTKTEAKAELGVRNIIDDSRIYDYLKLFAQFTVLAGFSGLVVSLDEMVVFSHGLNHPQARNQNYEMILRIVNDCLQGQVSNLMFLFAGTDDFLNDKRRGIKSYQALASRLADNQFAVGGLKDFSGPVITLANLTREDLYVLVSRIRAVFDSSTPGRQIITDEGMQQFLDHCVTTLGAEFYMTPRDAVKQFVGLLSVLEQNPTANIGDLLKRSTVEKPAVISSVAGSQPPPRDKDDMASIQL
jgi:hypothetical protein